MSEMGWPLESLAGLKRALRVRMLHVALSSAVFPEDDTTEQPVTRPLVPISSRTLTVPSASSRCAETG